MAIDHHHRRQAATAQAGDFVHREGARGVGIGSIGDGEIAAQFFRDLPRSADVAGCPMADADQMFAHRRTAELAVEGGGPGNLGRRDAGDVAETAQRFIGKVAVVGLDGCEERDGGLFAAAVQGDGGFDEGEVQAS
jgi:hypothetical protein